jgi:YHS domain-containing protein
MIQKKSVCEYLSKVSQLIKDHTGENSSYTDTYYFCSQLKKRITKKHCKNCKLYKSII